MLFLSYRGTSKFINSIWYTDSLCQQFILNGTLSVLSCNLFRFHKEAVPALRLEFSRSCTVGVREFLCKNGCKVSKKNNS